MPDLVWALTCKSVITDVDTNSVSYLESLHGLAARRLPAKLPKVMLATIWRSSKGAGDVLRMRLRVEKPGGKDVASTELPVVHFDRPFQRLNINLAGADIPEAGEYSIVVESFSRKRWKVAARLPFTITIASSDDEPAG